MAMALKKLGPFKADSTKILSPSSTLRCLSPAAGAGPRRNSLMGKLGSTLSLSKPPSKRSILLSPKTKKKNENRVNFDLTVSLIKFDETGAAMNTRSASQNQFAGDAVNKLARLWLKIPNIFQTSSGIVRIIKRQLLVLAHLYTMWALPFDAVFGDFTESKTGMLVSLLAFLIEFFFPLFTDKNKINLKNPARHILPPGHALGIHSCPPRLTDRQGHNLLPPSSQAVLPHEARLRQIPGLILLPGHVRPLPVLHSVLPGGSGGVWRDERGGVARVRVSLLSDSPAVQDFSAEMFF